jgi:cyclophilin family peptidyl-prolyl cis-trans isomerase
MRPALAIFGLIVAGVVLAAFVSLRTTHPDPLPGEVPPKEATNTDNAKPDAKPTAKAGADSEAPFDKVQAGKLRASLEIVGRGTIEMEFYPKAAPKTVAHIAELAGKNFWDKIKVHRVDTKEQVVQMGDPTSIDSEPQDFEAKGIGSHGSGTSVPLEVSAKLPNLKYTVGLARTQDPNSGDSQIYINTGDNPGFDFDYCVFGRVVKGTDIVSKIAVGDVIKHIQVYEAGQK